MCSKCGETKPASEYSKDKQKIDGLYSCCKACKKSFYQNNKKRILAQKREYWENNKEHLKKANYQRWINGKEKRLEKKKEYYQKNKEIILEKKAVYNKDNRDLVLRQNNKYYQKNKETVIKKNVEYTARREKTDLSFKIKRLLSRRILLAVKKGEKSASTARLLGCTILEFIKYMEAKFAEGMTWENHGLHGWHIDHIMPCASFDLTDTGQQKACFHYTNMQPLWAEENHKKSDKIAL